MALKTITFTVGADGALSPATIQDAGVQGDHRKTEAVFKFSDGLYTYLQGKSADGKLVYRFDGYDGEGAVYHSDTAVLCEREVVYPLEYFLTRHGGLVKVELIITLINGEESAEVLHTPAAQLKFIFAPYSTGDKAQEYSDLSALAEIVKQCAARAETAERAAEEARAQTAMLAAAFENGTTYIFDGGNASGEIDAAFIIDGEMSEYSYNAVKNKVIKAYVDETLAGVPDMVQNNVKSYAYPIGCIVTTNDNKNPKEKFAGEWKLIDKEFESEYISIDITADNRESNGYFVYSDSTISSAKVNIRRSGHTITVSAKLTTKKDLKETDYDDSNIPIGDFALEALGIESIGTAEATSKHYFHGFDDYDRAVAMFHLNWYNGFLYIGDILSGRDTTANGKISAGQDIVFSVSFNVWSNKMLDAACGKFYWQKTAD